MKNKVLKILAEESLSKYVMKNEIKNNIKGKNRLKKITFSFFITLK